MFMFCWEFIDNSDSSLFTNSGISKIQLRYAFQYTLANRARKKKLFRSYIRSY